MVIQMNVAEAKAKLSELLEAAVAGNDVVIARSGRAIARLVPIAEPAARTLGFFPLTVDDELFTALPDHELDGWE